ncbi:MAG: flagellar hook-basal body complex protein FliE [Lentisphaerae bacterium]|nr:MAG: flagellar hook-basal body complex protein FliE [Lentisphaerota bacterium]
MVDGINPGALEGAGQFKELQNLNDLQKPDKPEAGDAIGDFEKMLMQLVQEVDHKQKIADSSITQLAAGEAESIQDVVMKLEEAEMTFQLMKEIRDKLVAAYKDVMSMQS